ncbi:putative fimbrial usher protein StbD [Citrobacter freundii]|nr:putative fimbrial usher protein StbD [Citrobacter freundii]
MGLLAPESSVNSAWGFNLITGKTVTWLLDTQYGAPGRARGVGVRVYRAGSPVNFMAVSTVGSGSEGGWMPVIGSNTQQNGSQDGINYYSESFEARLASFGADTLTAGGLPVTCTSFIAYSVASGCLHLACRQRLTSVLLGSSSTTERLNAR